MTIKRYILTLLLATAALGVSRPLFGAGYIPGSIAGSMIAPSAGNEFAALSTPRLDFAPFGFSMILGTESPLISRSDLTGMQAEIVNPTTIASRFFLAGATPPRQKGADTVITKTDDATPTRLFADQNYPNPFGSATNIRYGLPKGSRVKITVHTMLGSVVKTVVDEYQQAGVYNMQVTLDNLMPGIYLYRIETDLGSLTRRMTVSRS